MGKDVITSISETPMSGNFFEGLGLKKVIEVSGGNRWGRRPRKKFITGSGSNTRCGKKKSRFRTPISRQWAAVENAILGEVELQDV